MVQPLHIKTGGLSRKKYQEIFQLGYDTAAGTAGDWVTTQISYGTHGAWHAYNPTIETNIFKGTITLEKYVGTASGSGTVFVYGERESDGSSVLLLQTYAWGRETRVVPFNMEAILPINLPASARYRRIYASMKSGEQGYASCTITVHGQKYDPSKV